MGRFDVRHAVRGDVARMAAYFLAIYQIEAEDGSEGRAFIERTLDVLLDWHETDVVDQDEQTRNDRIHAIQGNSNPFTLDPTLLRRALYQGDRERPRIAPVWINEIHYANDGVDTGEGVEIAGPAGVDLYGYRLWFYSRSGRTYGVDLDPGAADERAHRLSLASTLSGTHGSGHLGALWIRAEKMRGGCNGLALIAPNGAVEQFVSYGGCRFNALAGPVYDFASQHGASVADTSRLARLVGRHHRSRPLVGAGVGRALARPVASTDRGGRQLLRLHVVDADDGQPRRDQHAPIARHRIGNAAASALALSRRDRRRAHAPRRRALSQPRSLRRPLRRAGPARSPVDVALFDALGRPRPFGRRRYAGHPRCVCSLARTLRRPLHGHRAGHHAAHHHPPLHRRPLI